MPVGPYQDFASCVAAMKDKGHDEESAKKICGKMEQDSKPQERKRVLIAENVQIVISGTVQAKP